MAEGSADIAASIAELQALLLGTESIDGFLHEMAMLPAGTLGDSLSCGITLQPNGRPLTAASSDQSASQVDELQYGLHRDRALGIATLLPRNPLSRPRRLPGRAPGCEPHHRRGYPFPPA